ncbi:MAG: UDP-N-acetylglucosamine 2-epimerase (non-hydrolyzing) [Pirellula sp.]|nr:UDP-N-acetylglucosamine 2-epimerase (non-hydrolyzing) [Pirellula sp.]
MRRQRLFFAIGTRPEAVKLAPLVRACRALPDEFETIVCLTGQHRELVAPLVEFFDLRPACDLQVMSANQTLAELASRCLRKVDDALAQFEPDFVIVQGDTTTAVTTAEAAFYRKLRIVHVEAGLRTGDLGAPFPEEFNRRVISLVATLHCAPTERAAATLRREGVPEDRVRVTGNTVIDALLWTAAKQRMDESTVARLAPGGTRSDLSNFAQPSLPYSVGVEERVVLVTAHRRESFGDGVADICAAVRQLAERYADYRFIWPVHANPKVRVPVEKAMASLPNVQLIPPLDYPGFVRLMDLSTLVLTDSGGIQEEAPSLGKPVLVLRDTTERQEGIEAGCAELVGTNTDRIVARATHYLEAARRGARPEPVISPYGDGRAAERIVGWIREVAK